MGILRATEDVELERSTLADWVGGSARLLEPLVEALHRYVTTASKLHADDTPVPVLAPGQGKTKTGRLWTYVRDDRPAGDKALRLPYGSPIHRIAKANIPRSIWKSFAVRCRLMPMRASISSTKMAAFSRPRAGRMCGVTFTIWNRRMPRR